MSIELMIQAIVRLFSYAKPMVIENGNVIIFRYNGKILELTIKEI